MRVTSVLVGLVTAIVLAAPAHSDPDEDSMFLSELATAGITVPDPGQAIASAHAVCGLMNNGETGLQVVTDVKNQNPALTLDGAALFAAIACNTYCSVHLGSEGGYF